jgi:hypothetical protein
MVGTHSHHGVRHSWIVLFQHGRRKNLMTPTRQVPGHKITAAACDPDAYPCFEPLMYTLDVFLPMVNLRQQAFWLPNSRDGFWYAVLMWCLILVGWVLTTTVVIGFNNQFRKE